MDSLKGLLIYLVVLGHLLELFGGPARQLLYQTIYLFHMPAFVFCSGWFARLDGRRLLGRLVWPYAVYQTLYLAFARWVLHQPAGHGLTTPYWLMWYLFSMVLWTLCTPLLKRLPGWAAVLGSAAVALAAGYCPYMGYPFSLSRTLVLLPFFAAGYALGHREKRPAVQWRRGLALTLGAAGAAASLIVLWCGQGEIASRWLYHSFSYAQGGYGPLVRGAVLLAGAAWTVFLLALLPERKLPLLSALGARTMPVFLLHGFLVRGIERLGWFSSGGDMMILWAALLAAALCLLLGSRAVTRALNPTFSAGWLEHQKK